MMRGMAMEIVWWVVILNSFGHQLILLHLRRYSLSPSSVAKGGSFASD